MLYGGDDNDNDNGGDNGPLASYLKLRVAHAPGMSGPPIPRHRW